MGIITLILQAFVTVVVIIYFFRLRHIELRFKEYDQHLNFYKGMGDDYEKWQKQNSHIRQKLEEERDLLKIQFKGFKNGIKHVKMVTKHQSNIDIAMIVTKLSHNAYHVLNTIELELQIFVNEFAPKFNRNLFFRGIVQNVAEIKKSYKEMRDESREFLDSVKKKSD